VNAPDGTWAHSPSEETGEWHDLRRHLCCVADMARRFAAAFGGGDVAYWAGLWHDLGKYSDAWQTYLRASYAGLKPNKVPHAMWGAAVVYRALWGQAKNRDDWKAQEAWKDIALPIAGHHTGLAHGGKLGTAIEDFLGQHPRDLPVLARAAASLPQCPPAPTPDRRKTRRELFVRMILSAVVDADSLDTEQHDRPSVTQKRRGWPTIAELWDAFQRNQAAMIENAEPTAVNEVRREVYDACIDAAKCSRGFYRLRVPTGGGKTRSSLAFALKHAVEHDLRRVIVAIPYTSIVDQTADEYRRIFRDLRRAAVIEHHSQVPMSDEEEPDMNHMRRQLATENWDASLIVTTTVQLFESLFSNRRSQVRKLHNIAQSVIVLDEVQTLPPQLLEPTMDVLRALVDDYGVSIVFSTATQPALDRAYYLKSLQDIDVGEIVPEYPRHFATLRRVEYEVKPEPLTWGELADQVRREPADGVRQVMVVLNRRRDALAAIAALGETPDVFHLSTLLCGAHRRTVLEEIRDRLRVDRPRPVRLISTQVIEAGVHIDFPEVWRVMGPLDRIVQAAGRCNREGIRPEKGRVVIFEAKEGGTPFGPYRTAIVKTRALLHRRPTDDLHRPELYEEYFERLFGDLDLDDFGIQTLREELDYPEVSSRYRLINDKTVPVVVPYGDGMERLDAWLTAPSRHTWQGLQPFVVAVYERDAERLAEEGRIHRVKDGLYRCAPGEYHQTFGLIGAVADPADLIRDPAGGEPWEE
jgi:CRISPR-associated endonuclease/helicase Cas3